MKKRSLLLLALAAITAMPFASCGDDSESSSAHEHTYATTWSADADNHWYGATCEHTDQKANVAPHTDEDNDGACDVCEYDGGHEHTYADTWTNDETKHWHAATCNHAVKSDEAAHADENNDGVCDVCSYVSCEHTYATDWTSDATDHWHAVTCGHAVAVKDKAQHVDADLDGDCDTCGWYDEAHTHTFADVWSKDETGHWYAGTCEHTGAKKDFAAHADENNDNLCDVCGWEYDPNHEHTYNATWSANATAHWYAATCGHDVKKDEADHYDFDKDGVCDTCDWYDEAHTHTYATEWSIAEEYHYKDTTCGHTAVSLRQTEDHVDENEDGSCDVCNALMDIASFIDTITSAESTAKVNGGNIKYTGIDYETETQAEPVNYPFFYGVNYTMSTTNYGTYYYMPFMVSDVQKVFEVQVIDDVIESTSISDDTSVLTQGYYFQLCNWCINEHGVENLVYEFYSIKDESAVYGFDLTYDATDSSYTINLLYYENESNVYEVSATFKTTEDVITELDMTIKTLGEGDYILNDTDKTYTLTEAAANSLAVYYEVTQTVGSRSEDASPYPVEEYLFTELALTYNDEAIVAGSTIEVPCTEYSNRTTFYFASSIEELAKYNDINVTSTAMNYSEAMYGYDGYGEVPSVYFQGMKAGEYTVTVESVLASFTFTVKVDWADITELNVMMYDEESWQNVVVTEAEMYAGQSIEFSAKANAGANSAFTAAVTTAPDGAVASVVDGVFTADIVGEYVITLTSVQDTTITATLTVTVNEAPSVAEVLNGTYSYEDYYAGLDITVVFTPASTGATNGTVVITNVESGMDYSTWEEYTNEYTETLTYAYADGVITLTHVSGDELGYTLTVNDSYGVSICTDSTYPDWNTFEMTKVESTSSVDYASELNGTVWFDISSNTYLKFDSDSEGVVSNAADPNDADWIIIFNFTVDAEGNISLTGIMNVMGEAPFELNDTGVVVSDISEVNLTYMHPMTGMPTTLIYSAYES